MSTATHAEIIFTDNKDGDRRLTVLILTAHKKLYGKDFGPVQKKSAD